MVIGFINPVLTRAPQLGVAAFQDTDPVELWPSHSEEEIEIVIRAVYRQVLGNTYVMDSERLTVAESQLRNGEISVREFVRQVAKSELYYSRFFESCSRNRAIELNFKHLLGRAPESYEEIIEHTSMLDQGGYEAEIDSYIDSEEYQLAFGENQVPYYRGYKTQIGKSTVGFTHILKLLRGAAGSDQATVWRGNWSRLNQFLMSNSPSKMEALSGAGNVVKPTDVNKLLANVLGLNKPQAADPTQTQTGPKILSEAEKLLQNTTQTWQRQYQAWEEIDPIELWPGRSEAEIETVIRAVYRQVLGNAHVMESERLTVPESQIKRGEITVREFVRQVAKSELYRSRFFDICPRYRSIELNFKHLLGRAPDDYSETFYHSQVLDEGGFEADIDSYIDSDEYQEVFGENVVPFYRGYKTQTGKKLLGFTNMFVVMPSVSSSDKDNVSGNPPRLNKSIIYNNPLGQAPVTDIQALLDEVLKPKIQPQEAPKEAAKERSEAYQAIQRQCQEQEELLESLQQQLADLRPLASFGASQYSKWQSYSSSSNGGNGFTSIAAQIPMAAATVEPDSYEALQQKSEKQAQEIAKLQEKIADQRRLAMIAEIQLNKWRPRSY